MPRFVDLDPAQFAGALVIVDVDGTITHDRNTKIDLDAEIRLTELARVSDVYLCSNGLDDGRTRLFAESVPGVRYLDSIYKKPSKLVLGSIEIPANQRVVVIGDKHLTDGRFARNIGAEFVQVSRVRSSTERPMLVIMYFTDDLYSFVRRIFSRVRAALALLRTQQWVKNVLVFAPLFFAQEALSMLDVEHAAEAFALFCLAASAVYIMNDLFDLAADRAHPIKRARPIASGAISPHSALVVFAALSLFTAALLASMPAIAVPIGAYVALNLLYSRFLKHIAVIDIACVASFYILRILAGGAATAIYVSPWIILCVFFGALFLVVGKRRAEAIHENRRFVIDAYSIRALDYFLAGSAILAVMSYGIYTIIGARSPLAVYSTIFVVCALFRLLNRIYSDQNGDAEFPEALLFKDRWALASFAGWVVYMAAILYAW